MRLDYALHAKEATDGMYAISRAIAKSKLSAALRELVSVFISQHNKCAHCTAVHWEKALHAGVSEEKLRLVAMYAETTLYTEEEHAALALAAAMNTPSEAGVSDAVWERAAAAMPEDVLIHLVYQITLMHAWNRLSVTLKLLTPRS